MSVILENKSLLIWLQVEKSIYRVFFPPCVFLISKMVVPEYC